MSMTTRSMRAAKQAHGQLSPPSSRRGGSRRSGPAAPSGEGSSSSSSSSSGDGGKDAASRDDEGESEESLLPPESTADGARLDEEEEGGGEVGPATVAASTSSLLVENEDATRTPLAVVSGIDASDDDEEEDGPPVEESMTQARAQALEARQRENTAREEQTRKRKRVAQAKADRHAANVAAREEAADAAAAASTSSAQGEEQAEVRDAPPAVKKGRLDPALFAAAFAPDAVQTRKDENDVASPSQAARRARARDSSVPRRDGAFQLDARTTIRSLQASNSSVGANVSHADQGQLPDYEVGAPTAKARGFMKRALGLRAKDVASLGDRDGGKKRKKKDEPPQRTEDDPLGLEDPLFTKTTSKSTMTGRRARGDKLHGTRPAASKSTSSLFSRRGEGGRTTASSAIFGSRSMGTTLGFRAL